MKEFTFEELAKFNGQNGQPAYVAHQGRVIDVSNSKRWLKGSHMKRHHSGADMTTEIQAAPHGLDVLDRFPQVGVIKKEDDEPEREIPFLLNWLLAKFPMLRRHPHPMTVHFPIVFMFSTTVFNILYALTGVKSFETTAFHSLGAGIIFTIIAILTGLYTWWLNYMALPVRAVAIKKTVSAIMLCIAIPVFIWRLLMPDVLNSFDFRGIVYFLLTLLFLPLVSIIGWFGAELTFPIEKE